MNLTETQRAELRAALAKAEHLAREHARILEGCRSILAEPPTAGHRPPVDPLAMYRLPSGAVGYAEESARWVMKGDYIQAVHGDKGRWEQVVATVHATTQTGITTATPDGTTRLRWWGHDDRVRVATAPVSDPTPYREDRADAAHRAETGGL